MDNLPWPEVVGSEDLRPEYRQVVEPRLRAFVRNGDDVMCVGVFTRKGQRCKLCDYHPITWNYVIENLATHQRLIAGCRCIENYEIILKEWGYHPEYLVFPTYFLRYARWMTDETKGGNPGAIHFHDDFLHRAEVDPIRAVEEAGGTRYDMLAHVPVKTLRASHPGQPVSGDTACTLALNERLGLPAGGGRQESEDAGPAPSVDDDIPF